MSHTGDSAKQSVSLDFENLVGRYYSSLYKFAYSLTQTEADACDLTQQTFYVWATKGHQLRDSTKVKTWLFTTLYREFIDSRRRDSRWEPLDEVEVESIAPSDQADKFDGSLAREALLQIDPVFRAPLTLFYLQDHSYAEIAEILDVPMGTVTSRIARGRDLLRELLLEHGRPKPVKTISGRPPGVPVSDVK